MHVLKKTAYKTDQWLRRYRGETLCFYNIMDPEIIVCGPILGYLGSFGPDPKYTIKAAYFQSDFSK